MAGLTRQIDLKFAAVLPSGIGVAGDTSAEMGITKEIIDAGDRRPALKIDLATTWWSTRLYLIASLAQRLTQVRRILVVDSSPDPLPPGVGVAPPVPVRTEERFIGQLSTSAILSTIGPKVPLLGSFAQQLQARPAGYNEVSTEIQQLLTAWRTAFGDTLGKHDSERAAKVDLTAEILRRWFGDAMLQQPMHIDDLHRASVVDLLRLLDYPNDFVPVLTRHEPEVKGQPARERVDVVDKGALNARLARSYLVELMDRARIN
jgi:hypothetical protein